MLYIFKDITVSLQFTKHGIIEVLYEKTQEK